mmetsp:Transcript_4349/g.15041  ORF Transcript_4349/g.15041 Transcript_4349/m.15041 type:complete len:241 (-) Transcript_4349:822-1544(-)
MVQNRCRPRRSSASRLSTRAHRAQRPETRRAATTARGVLTISSRIPRSLLWPTSVRGSSWCAFRLSPRSPGVQQPPQPPPPVTAAACCRRGARGASASRRALDRGQQRCAPRHRFGNNRRSRQLCAARGRGACGRRSASRRMTGIAKRLPTSRASPEGEALQLLPGLLRGVAARTAPEVAPLRCPPHVSSGATSSESGSRSDATPSTTGASTYPSSFTSSPRAPAKATFRARTSTTRLTS